MLDIQRIRNETEAVRRGLDDVGADLALIDEVLRLDERRRELQREGDRLRAELNARSKEIGRQQDPARREQLIEAVSEVKRTLKESQAARPEIESELEQVMLRIPNVPLPEVPVGAGESANAVQSVHGAEPSFDFEPLPHWDLMTRLGIIDFERGQKTSGTRFYFLRGAGARLQRALITWMLDLHVGEHGYEELYPPALVRSQSLVGTGNLPKFGDNLYRDAEEDLWLVPTAEVSVTNFHGDEVLDGGQLPIRYAAYSPCFRREKMSHGKDTRGIKRGHQFDKVELVQLVRPERGREALVELLGHARAVLERLGLHHRVVEMCTGDLSFVACRKFDLEVWAPGCGEWLEVSSCSLFGDFQSRRARIRFKDEDGKNRFAHTLNGSGLALPRLLIALVESFQRENGSIIVPDVLRPYMNDLESIDPAG
ncbi:MAG: serine--tRNA ligase [Polyangia bacterium]